MLLKVPCGAFGRMVKIHANSILSPWQKDQAIYISSMSEDVSCLEQLSMSRIRRAIGKAGERIDSRHRTAEQITKEG